MGGRQSLWEGVGRREEREDMTLERDHATGWEGSRVKRVLTLLRVLYSETHDFGPV